MPKPQRFSNYRREVTIVVIPDEMGHKGLDLVCSCFVSGSAQLSLNLLCSGNAYMSLSNTFTGMPSLRTQRRSNGTSWFILKSSVRFYSLASIEMIMTQAHFLELSFKGQGGMTVGVGRNWPAKLLSLQ